MNKTFQRDLNHNYLVLEEEEENYREDYQLYMLTENRIQGLLACKWTQVNDKLQLCYEITSRQSMDVAYERKKISYQELRRMLVDFHQLMITMKEYMLDANHLILEPGYLYVDVDTGGLALCYCPFYERDIKEAFYNWAEYVLGKLERHDKEGIALGYELYRLAGEENSSVEEILRSCQREQEENEKPVKEQPVSIASKEPEQQPLSQENIFEPEKQNRIFSGEKEPDTEKKGIFQRMKDWFRGRNKKESMAEQEFLIPDIPLPDMLPMEEPVKADAENQGEKDIIYGETTLLCQKQDERVMLISEQEGYEDIWIDTDSFLIGKKREAVDGYIGSMTVSRIHARITHEAERYLLTDLHSTNGTYINGIALEADESVELHNRDMIRFADMEYSIQM